MANERSSSTSPSRLRRIISVLGPTRLIAILAVTTLIIAAAIAAGVRSRTEVADLAVSPGSAASSSAEQTSAPTSVGTSVDPGRGDEPAPVLSASETLPVEQENSELSGVSASSTVSQSDRTGDGLATPFATEPGTVALRDNPLVERPAGLNLGRAQMGGRDYDENKSSQTQKQTGLGKARVETMRRAKPWDGDLRLLPFVKEPMRDRPEREGPRPNPGIAPGTVEAPIADSGALQNDIQDLAPAAPAPTPTANFAGLDNATFGAGHPPDTNGDVGPTYYIQTINTAIGIYDKSSGTRVAAFTFNTFMSQGQFGNICDTQNFGDPVVLYDTFEDRWVISDFAFQVDASGNVSPQVALQCFAVSKTGNPVSGGWNYYWINTTGGLGDYPKLGIWPDGLYMSVNMFDYAAAGSFQNARVYALNKAQMYAGAPTVQTVSFDLPSDQFSVLPANARLQTGTPPAGSPNYMASVWNFLNSMQVWKFKVDWSLPGSSAVTGPFDSTMGFWWAQYSLAAGTAPTPKNANDTLYPRLMVQNQYTNIGGVESVWNSHTVGGGTTPNPTTNVSTSTQTAVRYYQVNVTGGTVSSNTTQAFTYSPDTTVYRYMPSSAVDRLGDMAIGYTTSNSTTNPALKYAGRLAGDAANSITQTEQTLIQGTGAQTGNCGGTCTRWGDYSAMTLDPDGCTFWYTNEYYNTNDLNHITRIGSFKLNPACTAVGTGTISGQVTANPGGAPISGATVTLGSRTTTTDGSGNYSFTGLPQGTYPTITASYPGKISSSATGIVVTNGGTTTQNFSLAAAAGSGCGTDTSLTDFQAGTATNTDLTSSANNVVLQVSEGVDAQSTTETQAFGFSNTSWFGQTFTPTVTGQATKVAFDLFCSSCTGTPPNVVISIRAASGNLPTGADLASASIPFSNSASGGFYTATFSSPPTLTAGTQYALVVRMASAYATGTPAYITSTNSAYAGGRRTTSPNSGGTWTGTTPDTSFKVTMSSGYKTSGDFTSGVKDANPGVGANPTWGNLSWTATTPASTAVKFQAAASNNPAGPFSFVGPDGTAGTFFTNGGSLSQFNGSRYVKYKALLSSSNSANTPSLADVSICFVDQAPTSLAVASAAGTFGGTVDLSATLTSGGSGVSGKTVDFKLNNVSVGSGVTNASGVATLANASLAGISVGNYPAGVAASFGGDGSYLSSTATNSLSVAAPLYGISGTVVYGGTPAGGTTKYVPGVTVTASGASLGSVQSDSSGAYSLGSLSGGNNTVTPTRSGDINSINSTDSLRIQQYLVGSTSFTAAQLAAADVSNNGAVNSTDALRIQQWIVGTPTTNVVGQWRFIPASRNYASLGSNLSNENYTGILMGEVSGNWVPPGPIPWTSFTSEAEPELAATAPLERPVVIEPTGSKQTTSEPSAVLADVTVTLPTNATASNGTTVSIPVNVSQLPAHGAANEVFTYNFNVQFNSTVLTAPTSVSTGTISAAAGGSLVTSSPQSGVVSVSYTNPNGITGVGTLLYLQFTVAGSASQQSSLTFVGTTTSPVPFEFNEGDPTVSTNTGQFTVSSPTAGEVSIQGRVVTAMGYGVEDGMITVTGTGSGVTSQAITGPFGYFNIAGLDAGETYVITVSSKRYTFAQPSKVMTLNDSAVDLIFMANP